MYEVLSLGLLLRESRTLIWELLLIALTLLIKFSSQRPAHLSRHAYHCSRQFDGMLRRSGPTSAEAESIKLEYVCVCVADM